MNEDKITKVAAKLLKARAAFHSKQVTKTGKNEFAKYFYFELSDFLPQALDAFGEVGLVGLVSFNRDEATLLIVDTESGERIPISSPMSEASLRGCHPVQNLGAVQTYLRRYLWAAAMELVESDPVDSAPPAEKAEEQVGPTPRAKPPVAPVKTPPRAPQHQERASRDEIAWRGQFLEITPPKPGKKPNGDDYVVSFIKFQLSDGEIKECAAFKEDKITEAQWSLPQDNEVIARVRPSIRNPGKFEYLGMEKIQDDPGLELVESE